MRIKGNISRFGHKGFGFIIGKNGKEYFLHQNDIEKSIRLKQNDEVSFAPDENERGLIARKVQLIKNSQSTKKVNLFKRPTNSHRQNAGFQSIINPKLVGLFLIVSIGLNIYLLTGGWV